MSLMQIEVNIAVLIAFASFVLSIYSVIASKKRSDNSDLKEATALLTQLKTKMETIENAVLGKPTLSELTAVHARMIKELERRVSGIENRNG